MVAKVVVTGVYDGGDGGGFSRKQGGDGEDGGSGEWWRGLRRLVAGSLAEMWPESDSNAHQVSQASNSPEKNMLKSVNIKLCEYGGVRWRWCGCDDGVEIGGDVMAAKVVVTGVYGGGDGGGFGGKRGGDGEDGVSGEWWRGLRRMVAGSLAEKWPESGASSKTTCFVFLKDGEPAEFGNVILLPFESTSKDEAITLRGELTGRATTPHQRRPAEGGTTYAPTTLLATGAATTILSSSSVTLAAEPAGLPIDIGTSAGLAEKEAERFPGK
uniref:Uncharacterized protein n=1 Tax=Tanacetum cinerariifolium TaxID=118510 RepID=A0A6L2JMA3_TANCI|nr:hypothetical protein [Tanacetum cinerariifolium]